LGGKPRGVTLASLAIIFFPSVGSQGRTSIGRGAARAPWRRGRPDEAQRPKTKRRFR